MSKQKNRMVDAVVISSNIIWTLQEQNGAGVTELANRLGHSKSTVHNHLQTLENQRLVVKDDSQYRLSLRFLDVASHVKNQLPNYDIIREEVDSLAEETGEVAQFGIEEHGRVSYLYKSSGSRGVETASSVGTQQTIHSTSLGKSIMAHMPKERVHEILDRRGMAARTDHTITDRDELFHKLAEIRERGYAIDDQENVEGLCCIAAPVKSDHGDLGAVSVSWPSSRFGADAFIDELPAKIMRAANVIELNSKFG
ncbi:MAG: IclR family transcriptional regulator [Natronomonas sp.]|uniref:IclR family transcriptional regulator n=1 Tax=Natronomonas sp. TaxID=2184060 RepID=UPI002870402F|nr:IclR family transcriptional regulator [Natronomonas sp.]MDR9381374.1 IclR family transcriptional regulator [Natronomonas sp.]MDR9431387.1 IclR family transcriptional regulator [Natronomonas sp.]